VVVLFFDDWHWSDAATRQLLDDLIGDPENRILAIATSRQRRDIMSIGATQEIWLQPLSFDACLKIAYSKSSSLSPFQAEALARESSGNPLVIEELCRQRGKLSYPAPKLVQNVGTSSWLNTMYEARLQSLGEPNSSWVRIAAVIGLRFSRILLDGVSESSPSNAFYSELEAQDLVDREGPGPQYSFKHGLIRDAIYASVGLRRRRELHLRIATFLEQNRATLGDNFQDIAYHFYEGASFQKAARYSELSAETAHKLSALDSAQSQYLLALRSIEKLPKGESSTLDWDRVLDRYGIACLFDPSTEPLEVFTKARDLARQRKNAIATGKAEYMLGYLNYALGRPRLAIRHCMEAIRLAGDQEHPSFLGKVRATLGHAHVAICDYGTARPLLEASIVHYGQHEKNGKIEIGLCYSLVCFGALLADQGDFAAADLKFHQARQALHGLTHEVEASLEARRSAVLIWQQRWGEAIDAAERTQNIARKIRSLYLYAMGRSLFAYAQWSITKDKKYLEMLSEATHWLQGRQREQFLSLNFGWLCHGAQETGDAESLRHYYGRALQRARRGDLFGLPMAARAMALGQAQAGNLVAAHRYIARASWAAEKRDSAYERIANDRLGSQLNKF
jgi:hypothetical protein